MEDHRGTVGPIGNSSQRVNQILVNVHTAGEVMLCEIVSEAPT
jgi:hypothetical protein